jgi:hypothetical protein
MRTIPLVLIALVLSAVAASFLSAGGARADGGWCANYGTGHSGSDCSFTSAAQCHATLSGLSGFCQPNPFPGTNYGRSGTWSSAPADRGRRYRADR